MEELFCVICISGVLRSDLSICIGRCFDRGRVLKRSLLVLDDLLCPYLVNGPAVFEKSGRDNWKDLDASSCSW
jgi:hypothetical protein